MRAPLLASNLLALAVATTACGGGGPTGDGVPDAGFDCSTVTGTDTFSAGMSKTGSQGKLIFKLMASTPAPPARGNDDWQVALVDATSSAPVSGATVTAVPFMPDHHHGTQIKPTITEPSAGLYDLNPINLWMPGVWQVTITATPSGGTADVAVFTFCIPG